MEIRQIEEPAFSGAGSSICKNETNATERAMISCFSELWSQNSGIETFPDSEIYCLTSQFRRVAVSVPANIAEGFKKNCFMNIAQGSLEECRYYLILANDLKYGDSTQLLMKLDNASKLLEAYSISILKKQKKVRVTRVSTL